MIGVIDRFSPAGMHGREDDRRTVLDLLQRVARGGGGVVLAEGEPGTGKSVLLRTAVDEAATRGFSLAAGATDQLGRTIPLFALRAALGEPFARFTAGYVERDERSAPAWWIGRMRAHLEQQAAAHPVLVCLDDVQWTCPATLAALRTLPRALARRPVAWVLARSGSCSPDAERLFDVLEADGAVRLGMSPLPDDEVTGLLTEAFGAPPDQGLMALAAEAAGNPSLLVELIAGLRDDDAVRSEQGRAVLTSSRLPERVHRVARKRLDGVGKPAQHLLMTAAVLGPSVRLEDAAELIGECPAALLPVFEETMSAGIMTAVGNVFCFRQPLLGRAVHDMIPQAGRTALHRQYGRLLLGRGELAVEAAGHLLQAVRAGDQASLADLDAAATQTSLSAPETAARLALRALELTPSADPDVLPRAVTATEALACAGRLDQAFRLARETLAKPLPPAAEIRLRCALSCVLCSRGQAGQAAAEAGMALAHPRLPAELRDLATAARLRALAESHDETAGIAADTVLTARGQHDGRAVVAALIARAVNRWDQGQVSEALESLRDAWRRAAGIAGDARHGQPLLSLAAALIDLRQFDEAEELVRTAGRSMTDAIPARAMLSILCARLHLAGGRLDGAAAAGQQALATAQELGAHGQAAAARRVLALTALRRGDIAAATQQMAGHAQGMPDAADGHGRTETALIQARISQARGDASAARGLVRQVGAGLESGRGPLLDAHASVPWLVRVALAGGDTRLAETVACAAETLAAENRGYPSLTAAAAHGLGLVREDQALLAEAAALHPDPWSRASAAEDLGTYHARRADRGRAVRQLAEANQGYESIGATADTARVRSRLRHLGVRRRHWTQSPGRPDRGWESLTETQHTVSELTAQGLNNRQIAAGMYLSSATVAFHLRQIFRKLDISSRVELTRIVIERNLSPSIPPSSRKFMGRPPLGISMSPMN
jgi:DNA-binding CsgD family transcriptional regulator/tetratricopeptide (TPR) repeat protein